jgi:phosphatidylglycerol:prolipoprotein diacylglycerol transferase
VIPDLFEIGPFTLHSFGLLAALALIVPAYFVGRDLRDRGRDPILAWEIAVGAGVGGFVGARIDYLIQNPDASGLFSSTGLVWYGGVIGGAIGVIAVSLWRHVPVGVVANIAAPALALGYAIGRIGCQLSGDGDYGSASSLPWAMSYPDGEVPTTELVHPTPLYETTSVLLVFWLLWRLRSRFDRPWALFGLWCILGGVERFLIEFIRRNDAELAGLTTAQIVSIVLVVLGAVILRAGRNRTRRVAATA